MLNREKSRQFKKAKGLNSLKSTKTAKMLIGGLVVIVLLTNTGCRINQPTSVEEQVVMEAPAANENAELEVEEGFVRSDEKYNSHDIISALKTGKIYHDNNIPMEYINEQVGFLMESDEMLSLETKITDEEEVYHFFNEESYLNINLTKDSIWAACSVDPKNFEAAHKTFFVERDDSKGRSESALIYVDENDDIFTQKKSEFYTLPNSEKGIQFSVTEIETTEIEIRNQATASIYSISKVTTERRKINHVLNIDGEERVLSEDEKGYEEYSEKLALFTSAKEYKNLEKFINEKFSDISNEKEDEPKQMNI